MNVLPQETVDMPFNCIEYIKNIFISRGMDELYDDPGI